MEPVSSESTCALGKWFVGRGSTGGESEKHNTRTNLGAPALQNESVLILSKF